MTTTERILAESRGALNVLAWYERATPEQRAAGLRWYDDARALCAEMGALYGVELPVVAAVVAALSPRCRWERNILDANNLIEAFTAGRDMESVSVQTFGANKRKAWAFLERRDWHNGPKTTAFVDNIANPASERVTVDMWAVRAFLNDRAYRVGNVGRVRTTRLRAPIR